MENFELNIKEKEAILTFLKDNISQDNVIYSLAETIYLFTGMVKLLKSVDEWKTAM